MVRFHSPGYPSMSLAKAVSSVEKIFSADRRNSIDRDVAAKHIGYGGASGASDKALSSLAHYGLVEKTGKGAIRVTQLAVDILHPKNPADKPKLLLEAGHKPRIFQELSGEFPGQVSDDALRSYLIRQNFQDIAIAPVISAYNGTRQYLEQSKAYESVGPEGETALDTALPDLNKTVFGGAKVGDLIQWEVGGVLQMEKPMRVRLVSGDGQWVVVEGSETGLPMNETTVLERAPAETPPPIFKLPDPPQATKLEPSEIEWMRNALGRDTKVRLIVSGAMGPKEIGKLIKLLEAQKAVLSDEDEDDGEKG